MGKLARFFLHSLRGRILASVVLLHAVLTGVIVLDMLARQKSFMAEELRRQAESQVRLLALNSAAPLLSNDLDQLGQLLESLERAPHLAFASIADADGRVRAATRPEWREKILDDAPSRALLTGQPRVLMHDGLVDAGAPVIVAGRVAGYTRIALSSRALEAELAAALRRGAAYAALAIVLGGLLAWIVMHSVTARLARLSDAADSIATGRLDLRLDPDPREDEVGRLNRDFAAMIQALREERARRDHMEANLHAEKELAQVTLASIGDAVITTDIAGRVAFMNPVACRLTGWSEKEARGRPLAEVFRIVHEESRQVIDNPVDIVLREGHVVGLGNHTVLIRRDAVEYNIEDSAAPIRDRDGDIVGVVLVFHDVTAAHEMAQKMNWAATHDSLTGLYNRAEFERRLAALVAGVTPDRPAALLYLDLDEFKVVNDSVGHAAGDELLRQLADLMKARVRETDTLARLGGDEFGVLLPDCTREQAQWVAESLLEVLQGHRFSWNGRVFVTGASVGLVAIDTPGLDPGALLAAADTACYAAKEEGRGRISVYHPQDRDFVQRARQMDWVSHINRALEARRLRLYWQPILPLTGEASRRHGEILLRMLDEHGNLVPPAAFLPAAERYHLMSRIDRWVVQESLSWLADHPEADLAVSINLSGQSLSDDGFLDFVLERLEGTGVDARRVGFEVTETAAIDNLSRAVRFMGTLKNHGCGFALDDFGAGLSSFGYLRNLPVDTVKIDGSFVRRIGDDRVDRAMVAAIREIAHVMGLTTVAEFVENEAILAQLAAIGVDFGQGFFLARPMPLEDALQTVRE